MGGTFPSSPADITLTPAQQSNGSCDAAGLFYVLPVGFVHIKSSSKLQRPSWTAPQECRLECRRPLRSYEPRDAALLMAAFHYVQNNLLMLSLASPPFFCPAVFFLRRSHWQLYHLMRSDFIKEGPLTTFPRSFNANASISRTGWQQIGAVAYRKKKKEKGGKKTGRSRS